MSAPPLSEARDISDAASFYNPVDEISYPVETTLETGEDMSPSQNNDSPQSLGESVPPGGGFKIAADLDSVQAPYIGEDGRLTLLRRKFREPATLDPADLREIDTMFRSMAGNSSSASASIPQETLRLLPSITRTLIQFVGELQANNSQLHMSYARLQAAQENLQARERHTEGKLTIYYTCVP
ncbi:hypothetical protein B0J14DRAFT_659159 [Halenospora varia]|nr:hypothetical protein B0J14DRAFT_659159 [Halenospora varia]